MAVIGAEVVNTSGTGGSVNPVMISSVTSSVLVVDVTTGLDVVITVSVVVGGANVVVVVVVVVSSCIGGAHHTPATSIKAKSVLIVLFSFS